MIILYSKLECIGYGQALSMSTTPRLHQLDLIEDKDKSVKIIWSAASKWKQLATRLHFEPRDISRIRLDNQNQCSDACLQVYVVNGLMVLVENPLHGQH